MIRALLIAAIFYSWMCPVQAQTSSNIVSGGTYYGTDINVPTVAQRHLVIVKRTYPTSNTSNQICYNNTCPLEPKITTIVERIEGDCKALRDILKVATDVVHAECY